MDKKSDGYHFEFAGVELTLPEMAESAFAMLRDDEAAESDPTACDHRVALPYRGGYACGTCHTEVELSACRYVWVNLDNGVVKIELGKRLGDLFSDTATED